MRVWLLICALALWPTPARAQDATDRPIWDLGGSVGWFASERDEPTIGFADDLNNRWVFEAAAGYYWTEHLRSEIELAATTAGSGFLAIPIEPAPNRPPYAYGEYRARDVRIAVQQFYQFGRNAWVHPYLGAGVLLSRETLQTRFDRLGYPYPSAPLPGDPETRTSWRVMPVVTGGMKTYLTPRAFFRAEMGVSPSSRIRDFVLTFGFGADLTVPRRGRAGR